MKQLLVVLWVLAFNALAAPGDLGYMLGIQEQCSDPGCQMAHLSILNYTFPPPGKDKSSVVCALTQDYNGGTTMFIGRTSAYDSNTGRYFLMAEVDNYTLYTAKVLAKPCTVTSISVPQARGLAITSMHWDNVDNILYAVFNSDMYVVDTTSGDLKQIGPISTEDEIIPTLTTAYDSKSHAYFIAVNDDIHGTYNLLTYFTRNQTSFITQDLQQGDIWTLYGMSYYPKYDQLLALCAHEHGWPSIKLVDYKNGLHADIIPEWIWNDYDPDYLLWPQSSYTNQIVWLDPELNIFWMTVQYFDPETLAFDDTLVYYNMTKGGVEMGSGPMTIYENGLMFTNYVWFNWLK